MSDKRGGSGPLPDDDDDADGTKDPINRMPERPLDMLHKLVALMKVRCRNCWNRRRGLLIKQLIFCY